MTLPTCNGWPNYPTWNVALWMDNEEGSYLHARELAHTAIVENTFDDGGETETLDRDGALYALAGALEAWHEEATPELEGFVADLHGWAVGHVQWRSIAEHLIEELTD